MGRLVRKVAIVTGAGSDIGRASARLFTQEGAKVAVADMDPIKGQETVKQIREAGGEATLIRVHTIEVMDMERLIRETVQTYGKLDILFNNIGSPSPYCSESVDEDVWRKIVDINLKVGFLATKFAVPEIRKRGGWLCSLRRIDR